MDQEALEDQRHITQLEHQVDLMDLEVLEDLEAQAVQAAPAAQCSWLRECTNERTAIRCPVDQAVRRPRRTRRPRYDINYILILNCLLQEDLEAQKANLNITCPNTTDQQDSQVVKADQADPEDQADPGDQEDRRPR